MPPRLNLIGSFRACTRVPQCPHPFVPLSARHGAPTQRPLPLHPASKRYSSSAPRPLTDRTSASASSQTLSTHKPSSHKPAHAPSTRPPQSEYEMTFTCTPCKTRSSHRLSKHGYHHGSVLITCPECRNRHVISDHLNIFGDKHMTIEDLMRERGQLVKKGTLSEDGDLEFWEDGSTTKRVKSVAAEGQEGEGQQPKALE